MNKCALLKFILLCLFSTPLLALDLTLTVQPVLPKAQIIKAYKPLADYLSAQTGHNVKVKAHLNFLTYWADMRRKKAGELVLDAAHFTDYRIQKNNYQVLAKLPESVSFTVVTHEDELVFDIEELVLKKVATMVSPSIGAIRLLNLFPDPMHQPRIVYAKDSNDAAQLVMDKKAFAAIIPSALVSRYEGLNTVVNTDSLPHMALSASPDIPDDDRAAIQKALVTAADTEAGHAMLQKLNFPEFEHADTKTYKGYSTLLSGVLGY